MDEYVYAIVKWVEASVKALPYIWSIAGLTFLLGVGNDAASDKNLEADDSEKRKAHGGSDESCATIQVNSNQNLDDQDKYNNCYMFAVDSYQADDQGFAIWKSLDQQIKPALSQIKTELWLLKPNADKSNPLVQAGGCIVMAFADPAVPGWLD
ncbi:hypothetical protein RAB80_003784 [Fusarium oxysporum f. sp. vasinfectum]|nr:hypothetical protein RAB80_003784 [Fusarium oxysporum f. sp. vasinfectum]